MWRAPEKKDWPNVFWGLHLEGFTVLSGFDVTISYFDVKKKMIHMFLGCHVLFFDGYIFVR